MSASALKETKVKRELQFHTSTEIACQGAGTLYFSSVRKAKGEPFQIRKSIRASKYCFAE